MTLFYRFDGFDAAAGLVGSLLSPVVYETLGAYGSLGAYAISNALALLYLIFCVREPLKREEKKKEKESRGLLALVKTYVYIPVKSTLQIVVTKRSGHLRAMLVILLACYGINYFMFEEQSIMYLWMLKVYEGFDGTDYAVYSIYNK